MHRLPTVLDERELREDSCLEHAAELFELELDYLFGFVHHFVEIVQLVVGNADGGAYQGVRPAPAFALPFGRLPHSAQNVQSQPIEELIKKHLLAAIGQLYLGWQF